MHTEPGVVLSRVGAGLTALLAVLYVGLLVAQGGVSPGEAGQVVAWAGSLVVAVALVQTARPDPSHPASRPSA